MAEGRGDRLEKVFADVKIVVVAAALTSDDVRMIDTARKTSSHLFVWIVGVESTLKLQRLEGQIQRSSGIFPESIVTSEQELSRRIMEKVSKKDNSWIWFAAGVGVLFFGVVLVDKNVWDRVNTFFKVR